MSKKQVKLTEIDLLQSQIDTSDNYSEEIKKRINEKFCLDWNFYSNNMEGNNMTKAQTREVVLNNITFGGERMKDILELNQHDVIIKDIIALGKGDVRLSEKRILDFHRKLLQENEQLSKEEIGRWKSQNNELLNYKNERISFCHFSEVPEKIHSLINKVNAEIDQLGTNKSKTHPVLIAISFHLEFVTIHPFIDGNGRMARLLMNLLLISFGLPPIIIAEKDYNIYYKLLADIQCYEAKMDNYLLFMMEQVVASQKIIIDAINGKSIDDVDDLSKKINSLSLELKVKKKKENNLIGFKYDFVSSTYLDLLLDIEKKLKDFDQLYASHKWSYLEEVNNFDEFDGSLSKIQLLVKKMKWENNWSSEHRIEWKMNDFGHHKDGFNLYSYFKLVWQEDRVQLFVEINERRKDTLHRELISEVSEVLSEMRNKNSNNEVITPFEVMYYEAVDDSKWKVWVNNLGDKIMKLTTRLHERTKD